MVNEVSNNAKVHVTSPVRVMTPAAQKMSSQEAVQEASNAPAAKPKEADVLDAMNKMQDFAQTVSRDLNFSVDEDSGEMVIKVIDSKIP